MICCSFFGVLLLGYYYDFLKIFIFMLSITSRTNAAA